MAPRDASMLRPPRRSDNRSRLCVLPFPATHEANARLVLRLPVLRELLPLTGHQACAPVRAFRPHSRIEPTKSPVRISLRAESVLLRTSFHRSPTNRLLLLIGYSLSPLKAILQNVCKSCRSACGLLALLIILHLTVRQIGLRPWIAARSPVPVLCRIGLFPMKLIRSSLRRSDPNVF